MVLRCFARRHLVAPRRTWPVLPLDGGEAKQQVCIPSAFTQRRHASTSSSSPIDTRRKGSAASTPTTTTPPRSSKAASSSSIPIGRRDSQRRSSLDFFTTRRPSDIGNDETTSTDAVAEAAVIEGAKSQHPLVRDLMRELQSHNTAPDPDLVWSLYTAIHDLHKLDFAQQEPSARAAEQSSVSPQWLSLPLFVHVRVLRAIAPLQNASSSSSTKNVEHLIEARHIGNQWPKLAETSNYMYQVGVIFGHMRKLDPEKLPSTRHYNEVMKHLSRSGGMNGLLMLWTAITANSPSSSSRSSSADSLLIDSTLGPGRARTRKAAVVLGELQGQPTAAQPDRDTYLHLMQGIADHLNEKISREYKSDRRKNLVPGPALQRKERYHLAKNEFADAAELYASDLHAGTRRINPQVRQALSLSLRRTVALLNDMMEKGVPMRKLMLDLALRVMRITGNIAGLKMVTKYAFGVDLDNVDAPVNALDLQRSQDNFRKPDVNTLNTLIMALGEQSSISKMVATYESLSKPLPISQQYPSSSSMDGGVFATDFRSMFSWGKSVPADTEQEQTTVSPAQEPSQSEREPVGTKWHPQYAILPNRATMEYMIRSACSPPSPDRALLQSYLSLTPKQLVERAKEYAARASGQYIGIASYLMDEALSLQHVEVMRFASELGMTTDDVDVEAVVGEIEALDKEGSTGLLSRDDEAYFQDYMTRLMVMAGDEESASAMWESCLTISNGSDGTSDPTAEDLKSTQESAAQRQADARTFLQRHTTANSAPAMVRPRSDLDTPTTPFVPRLSTPRVSLSPHAVRPVLTQAGLRDAGLMRKVGAHIRQAIALHIVELRALAAAHTYWEARVRMDVEANRHGSSTSTTAPLPADRAAMLVLVRALKQQYDTVHESLQDMAYEYQRRVRDRLFAYAGWRRAYRAHKNRRRVAELLETQQRKHDAQHAARSRAERHAARKAEAAAAAAAAAEGGSEEALRLAARTASPP